MSLFKGRLKPFWKSKAWQQSAQNKTGVFSWGDSNVANIIDPTGTLDSAIDKMTQREQDRLRSTAQSTPLNEQLGKVPLGFNFYEQKEFLYIIGALVAYKVFLK
tara:strand:+ start:738 stop:1049 length:312 start_codon:yes stop_codon:yes gene_type:complete